LRGDEGDSVGVFAGGVSSVDGNADLEIVFEGGFERRRVVGWRT
jgi:hypothetical protein